MGVLEDIGDFFNSLGNLFRNFPKLVICLFKLTLVSLTYGLLKAIPELATFLAYWPRYGLMATMRIVVPLCVMALVWLVSLVDSSSSVGVKMSKFLSLVMSCTNDPRGWYTVRRWHTDNKFGRAMGIYPCLSPCFRGYEPMHSSSSVLCKKAVEGPDFCPAAIATRAADGHPVPSGAHSPGGRDCQSRADALSVHQTSVARSVCDQAEFFGKRSILAPCFELVCDGMADSATAAGCARLVPSHERAVTAVGPMHAVAVLCGGVVAYAVAIFNAPED